MVKAGNGNPCRHEGVQCWLVVWLPWILFLHINWVYVIIPTDELIFFRGVALAHQPECVRLLEGNPTKSWDFVLARLCQPSEYHLPYGYIKTRCGYYKYIYILIYTVSTLLRYFSTVLSCYQW